VSELHAVRADSLVSRCVCVQVHRRGDVIQVKVLGIMALIDEGN